MKILHALLLVMVLYILACTIKVKDGTKSKGGLFMLTKAQSQRIDYAVEMLKKIEVCLLEEVEHVRRKVEFYENIGNAIKLGAIKNDGDDEVLDAIRARQRRILETNIEKKFEKFDI